MARVPEGPARPPVRWLLTVGLVGSLALGSPGFVPGASAAVITVTTLEDEFDDPGPGTGCSLREAIQAANLDAPFGVCPAGSGTDTIQLPAGVIELTIDGIFDNSNSMGDLDVGQDLTIQGQGAGVSIIDGAWDSGTTSDRILHVLIDGIDLTLDGLTVRGGQPQSAQSGGGILVDDESTLLMTNGLILHNENEFGTGARGGGLAVQDDAMATLRNVRLSNNFAPAGGGIFVAGGGALLLEDVIVGGFIQADTVTFPLRNSAEGFGGGILNEGTATLRRVSVDHNFTLLLEGGGIDNDGEMTIEESAVLRNSAGGGAGGGIFNTGTLVLRNVTASGNSSAGSGGGLANRSAGIVSLEHTTFTLNRADEDGNDSGDGGGIESSGGEITMESTILAGNLDPSPGSTMGDRFPDCAGPVTSLGTNLVQDTSGCAGLIASDLTGVDPLLGPLGDNGGPTQTHALLAGSPAVDRVASLPMDQRGVPRPFGGAADIGAYERYLCLKAVVDVVGTSAGEVIDVRGDPPADVVLALGGDDTVLAGPGKDRVCGGADADVIRLGSGRDQGHGQEGRDLLRGGGNPDLLKGGRNRDRLFGGGTLRDKGDLCRGGPGKDTERGCEGHRNV